MAHHDRLGSAYAAGYPEAVRGIASALQRLPGIGQRTACRLALALLEWPEERLRLLGRDIAELRQRVRSCTVCGNLAEDELCRVCADNRRDTHAICVVETAAQIQVIEAAGCFRGRYHVLGGRLQPLEDRGPECLRLAELRARLLDGSVQEVIIATSPDVEGEATAAWLAAEIAEPRLKVSRIAAGVPVGADLSFADSATMAMAMAGRRPMPG